MRRRFLPVVLLFIVVAGGVAFVEAPRFLVTERSVARADALIVMLGGLPYRAMTAGELFQQGMAPRIVLSRPAVPDPRLALFQWFGVDRREDDETALRILAAYGVPRSAVLVSVTDGLGTRPELIAVARLLHRERMSTVILVTDALHTRRASLYLRSLGGPGLRVIPKAAGPRLAGGWWWRTPDAESVLHEHLGLAAFAWHRVSGGLRPVVS